MNTRIALVMMTFLALAWSSLAQPATQPVKQAPVAGEKNSEGLTATLVANKASYVLDPSQSGKDFRDKASNAGKPGNRFVLPKPPAVDMTLVITNTSNQNVTITIGGDSSQIQLDLKGPGALSVDNLVAMTMDYRMGNPLTLAPGKSAEWKITSLAYGTRGISNYAYWTEVGDYTLTATQIYTIGEAQGKVTSAPAAIKVTKD